ncbi:MAG: hypothetical protein H6740_05450 [Alphaproteobacteria bacterium]|nr:hypothetical protein [Alphaproteobacteria bacterium]
MFEGLAEPGHPPGFALGPLSESLQDDILQWVGQEAYDSDWAPAVFGAYQSLDGESAQNYHYCFASQADAEMAIQYDADGAPIPLEVGEAGLVPPRASRTWAPTPP